MFFSECQCVFQIVPNERRAIAAAYRKGTVPSILVLSAWLFLWLLLALEAENLLTYHKGVGIVTANLALSILSCMACQLETITQQIVAGCLDTEFKFVVNCVETLWAHVLMVQIRGQADKEQH